ncbi:flagellar biosynthesis repressor FlbT [Jannaschia sp. KMU-145]|uniref:flagellar biosynthesis repressor FlbT n=1 Tax=Jannaschia halovivens TaxID=3388667 RepID=UPI00396B2622
MAGLMLKLPSGDRIVVNGAVIENAGRGARLRLLTPDTQLLRLRDAVDPAQAVTPVARLANLVQIMLVGECDIEQMRTDALRALVPLRHAFVEPGDRALIDRISTYLSQGQDYQALRRLGDLKDREAQILASTAA